MTDKQIKNIIFKIQLNAFDAKRKCLYKDCEEISIKSHLLQKKGIINSISENNHVYELAINPFAEGKHKFTNTGINEVFTFPGFCTTHDNNIFKEIESGDVSFFDYRTQLLLSYRAVMNEKRKKEIIIDYFNRILNSATLKQYLATEYFQRIKGSIQQQKLGIDDQTYYEIFFLSNINNTDNRDFSFLTIEIPRIEFCSSAVVSYETTDEINQIYFFKGPNTKEPLTEIYFNLLPLEEKSIIIIGCLNLRKDKCWEFIKSFDGDTTEKTLKKISDLLLYQVENWLCSPSIYRDYLKSKEHEIIRIVNESTIHTDERRELDFNLFEGIEM
jgi:hypothetical protein